MYQKGSKLSKVIAVTTEHKNWHTNIKKHVNKLGDMIPKWLLKYVKSGSNMFPEHNQEPNCWLAIALKLENYYLLLFTVVSSGLPGLLKRRPEKQWN